MIEAALKALGQILTPPFRKVLLKSDWAGDRLSVPDRRRR